MHDFRIVPKNPTSLVVLLHGVGANGEDLLGLGEAWQGLFPNTAFVSPDAHEPYDMAPFGRQWFSLRDRSEDALLAGAKRALPVVQNYIDGLLAELNLTLPRTVLLGFSQGTMTSLYAGLRMKESLAGILGYSGMLIGADHMDEITSKPPICLVHGTEDEVVPVQASQIAAAVLEKAGCKTELHLCPGVGHGVDPRGLEIGAAFLQRTLGSL